MFTRKEVQNKQVDFLITSFILQSLARPRLQELVREVDPTVQLDEEVEEILLQITDDFIDTALNSSGLIAKHRHASNVELKDVQLHLGEFIRFSKNKKKMCKLN